MIQWKWEIDLRDDTSHEGLQHVQQAGHGVHVAGDLFELVEVPRTCHFYGIKHWSDAGECSGGDGPVPLRAMRQELDVGDGVDDGGWEADEGCVAGEGDGKVVPVERKARLEIIYLNYGYE